MSSFYKLKNMDFDSFKVEESLIFHLTTID